MYVVVAGAGEVGRAIARTLRAEGHDVVVLDKDPEALELVKRLDVLSFAGSAASPAAIKAAGVEKAHIFYAVTADDEANLLACALAKARNPQCRTVARVNALEYMREVVSEDFKPVGCDVAVCPELVAAQRIARVLDLPGMVDHDVFAQGAVQVAESRVMPGSVVANRKVAEVALPADTRLVAVLREEEVFVPNGTDTLRADDRILAVAKDGNGLRALHQALGDGASGAAPPGPIKRVLVVGATRVGIHLARLLMQTKEVTIIDRDRQRCEDALRQLPEALVIQGDATDKETLEEEGIGRTDAVVGCEERDEGNILTCLLAKQLGVRRVVSFVNQGGLKNLAERIGIDLAVSPRQASIGAFVRYAHERAPVKLHLLAQGEAQLMEVEIDKGSRLAGVKLRRAGFPKNSLVAAIVRGKAVIVPGGDDFLQPGDRLVVFALTDAAPKLRKLL